MALEVTLGEVGAVVTVVATVVGGYWGLIKLAVSQYQRTIAAQLAGMEASRAEFFSQFQASLEQRFIAMEKAREEGRRAYEGRLAKVEDGLLKGERDLLHFKLDVSEQRVHREDYVRNQTLIEAKLDGIAKSFENALLRMRNKQ